MMFGGAIIALCLSVLAAITALYSLSLFIDGSNPSGLVFGIAFAGLSWLLFRIYRVYLRIARSPDTSHRLEAK